MTCIVGLIENDKVYLGADSLASNGFVKDVKSQPKVFKLGDFIIGTTGSQRMSQILRFSTELPKIYDTEIFEFMCTKFVDTLRSIYGDKGFLQKTSDGDEKGGFILVGYKNRLFEIQSDFSIVEVLDNFMAVGSGMYHAQSAMYILQDDKTLTPEQKLTKALESAEKFVVSVQRPFNFINT